MTPKQVKEMFEATDLAKLLGEEQEVVRLHQWCERTFKNSLPYGDYKGFDPNLMTGRCRCPACRAARAAQTKEQPK